jgi:hypothetical protein
VKGLFLKKENKKRDTRRRFEQWAHNPECEANTLSAVHGISMTEVAKAEGLDGSMGQSPFAIARGQTFERGLFKAEGKELRGALEAAEILSPKSSGFRDFRMRIHGGPMADLDKARDSTIACLKEIAARKGIRPTLIASPTLLIPAGVMLPEALLVIDVATVRYDNEKATFLVGEIKTYPDRGGYTDSSELALARAQAGVYVHALRMVIDELQLSHRLEVSDRGFLVLSRPGYNKPSVRANEDLRFQAKRAKRGFEMLEAAARQLPTATVSDDAGRIKAVQSAATCYNERCVSFCDRVDKCRQAALDRGDPAILGDDVARLMGGLDLTRAEDLLNGSKARNTLEERALTQLSVNR